MRAVQFDRVEAQPLRIRRRAGEGGDRIGDVFFRHGLAARLAGGEQARRALHLGIGGPAGVPLGRAGMPDLRPHLPARIVHRVDHLFPSGERGVGMEEGNILFIARCRAVDHRPFGQDQPDAPFGAAAVIFGIGRAGDAIGRGGACHRRHDDAIVERQARMVERLKQDIGDRGGHGGGYSGKLTGGRTGPKIRIDPPAMPQMRNFKVPVCRFHPLRRHAPPPAAPADARAAWRQAG